MTKPPGDRDRMRRARRLRTEWRGRDEGGESAADSPDHDVNQRRASDALDANDRIRAEAPDDLETRRRADQIEREVRDARRADEPLHRRDADS